MLKKYKLGKQIQLSFLGILLCTLISTILTMILFFVITMSIAYPANYYDKQIPSIMTYVQEHADSILTGTHQKELESQLDLNQMKYSIVNFEADVIYGNQEGVIYDEQALISKLNTRESDSRNNFTTYMPLINSSGKLEGCLILTYPIRMTPVANQQLVFGIIFLILFSLPFIYLILFMYLFGKGLKSNIMDPLLKLQKAANHIKSNDLDFELTYDYSNELGDVILSFEQMRKELRETLYRQWQVEQKQKEMVGALAHDLRSPLTIIKGHVEMLQDGAYLNEQRCLKYLESIEGATERATLLIEDLNRLSDLERISMPLYFVIEPLAPFLQDKVEEYTPLALQKQVQLKLIIPSELKQVSIKFDSLRLSQVLDNILMNAFRYATRLIQISMFQTEGTTIILTFDDDGVGFTKEELVKALDKFYRGDQSRSTHEAHSGLGLYICKQIVEQHGGKIEIGNSKLGGAFVRLTFPLNENKNL